MRKSSRGNPYHDARGRFTTANSCLTVSQRTQEEYDERTVQRELKANHEKYIAEYKQRIEKIHNQEELESIIDSARNDIGVSDVEYCDLYALALKKARNTHTPRFYETTTDDFVEFYNASRESQPPESKWRVSADYTAEDYEHMELYLADDGASFAIHDGDIVSVCTVHGGLTKGRHLLEEAVKRGGTKLDAYSGLFSFYTKCGFEPVSICEWDDDYAPDDWVKANGFTDDSWKDKDDNGFACGREDIVFFKYTGNKQNLSFEEWKASHAYDEDYDAAMKRRDKNL